LPFHGIVDVLLNLSGINQDSFLVDEDRLQEDLSISVKLLLP
jgi:hypothetical protein